MKSARSLFCIFFLSLLILSSSMISFDNKTQAQMIDSFPYRQLISLPIDIGQQDIAYQQIDIEVSFEKNCWARNEQLHSVRVAYEFDQDLIEVESQIYNLSYLDTQYIDQCRIVFLIPEGMTGAESFYVIYSDVETAGPNHPDHISLEDSSYFYEPISGQKMEFDYYKVIEDDYIIYGISYRGELFGHGISQVVARLKPETTTLEASQIDQFTSFSMLYSTNDMDRDYTGSSLATNINRAIIVDGNLMARVFIEGVSPEGVVRTSNVYTYYYSPSDVKRMDVLIHHEVLEDCDMGGSRALDGTYAYLMAIKSRSSSIQNLNIGSLLPQLQLFDKEGIVQSFRIPTDPQSEIEEMVLCTLDDMDLGNPPWFCIHDPDSKKTHGIIFTSNENVTPGWPDQDGIQIKSFVQQTLKLPGLEVDTGNVYATRNHFDSGEDYDWFLPEGFEVNLHAEFVSFPEGNYEDVHQEAVVFQEIAPDRYTIIGYETDDSDSLNTYQLTTFVHGARSFPFGSALAAITGRSIPYITAELYRADNIFSSGSVGRIPFKSISIDLLNETLPRKIISLLGSVDWRNASVFKRIQFSDIPAGLYLLKVFRENPSFSSTRQFIGYKIIDIQEDSTVHIFTGKESIIECGLIDQHGNNLEGVSVRLSYDGVLLSSSISDSNGLATISVPYDSRELFKIEAWYHGFQLFQEDISLGLFNRFFPFKMEKELYLHDVELLITDLWGFPFDVQCQPMIVDVDDETNALMGMVDDIYKIQGIPEGTYRLSFGFKSFQVRETIDIEDDIFISYVLPALYNLTINTYNKYGMNDKDGIIRITRESIVEDTVIDSYNTTVYLPPAQYIVEIIKDEEIIARLPVPIRSDKTIEVITKRDSFAHTLLFISVSVITLIAGAFFVLKRQYESALYCVIIGLLIISLTFPWWLLNGSTDEIETQTHLMLVPGSIVAFTSSSEYFAGELQIVPDEVPLALLVFSVLIVGSTLILSIGILLKTRKPYSAKYLFFSGGVITGIVLVAFLYLLSQLTVLGVGSIVGEEKLSISIPGQQVYEQVGSSWGPSIGFFLALGSFVVLAVWLLGLKRILKDHYYKQIK